MTPTNRIDEKPAQTVGHAQRLAQLREAQAKEQDALIHARKVIRQIKRSMLVRAGRMSELERLVGGIHDA
jgi:hypothetical protein